ncbi:hypothetical protein PE36_10118 [Moritella sp. PE36]|nr:hypothetical protein PE36_10118 [Moritella sp. PE36]
MVGLRKQYYKLNDDSSGCDVEHVWAKGFC